MRRRKPDGERHGIGKIAYRHFWDAEGETEATLLAVLLEAGFYHLIAIFTYLRPFTGSVGDALIRSFVYQASPLSNLFDDIYIRYKGSHYITYYVF